MAAYLAKQPAPDERMEIAIATLTAIYVNAHLKEGSPMKSAKDFLPYRDPWPAANRYSDVDAEVLAAFGVSK